MTIRHSALALAAVVFMLPQVASAEEPVETAMREWVAAVGATPGWSAHYGGLSYDAASDTAALSGLVIETAEGAVSVNIETLSVTGYSEGVDGAFSVASATIDTAAITVGFAKVAITDLSIDRLKLPAMAPFVYDKEKPFTSMIRGYAEILKASLDSARIGALDVIEQFDDITSRVSYEHFRIDGFANGKIASIRSGPLKMEAPSPQGLIRIVIGGVESRDMDLGAFIHVYDPDEYVGGVGDMVWHNALGLASYQGLEVEVPGAKVAFGGISIENFRIRQPPHSFAELYDYIMTHPNLSKEESAELGKQHAVDIMASFGIGRFAIDRLEVAASGIDHFRLNDFYISDFSIDGLGEFGMDGLDVAVPDQGSAKLGRFAFGGITFPGLDAIKQAIAVGEAGGVPDVQSLAPTLGFFELSGIDVRPNGEDAVRLGKFRVDLGDYVGFVPTRLAGELAGLFIPTSVIDNPEGRKVFERLGYDSIEASYGIKLHWDEPTETVSLDNISVAVKGVGSFVARMALAGITRDDIVHPERLDRTVPALSLVDGTFTFTDDSIVGKGLDILAETMKAPPDKFRQQFADAMPFLLSMSALNNPQFMAIVQKSGLLGKITPVVKEFVTTPGSSITISVSPSRPVSLTAIAEATQRAPETLVDLLGINVTGASGPPPAPEATPTPAPMTGDDTDPMRKTIEPQ